MSAAATPDDAITHPAAGQVVLTGRLGARGGGNARYLQQLYQQRGQWMLEPFRRRGEPWVVAPLRDQKNERDWAGEYAGKWLDAASLAAGGQAAGGPGQDDLRQQVADFAASLTATQASDGYLGIEADGPRRTSHWDVWNIKYALTGLLTHAEVFGSETSRQAARRAGDWLLDHYGPPSAASAPFFSGPYQGAVSVDVVDQLVRLYHATGQRKYLEFVEAVMAHFPPVAAMRASGRAPLIHAYSLTAYLGGVLEWAMAERRATDLAMLERVWDDLAQRHAYPTGSLGYNEELSESAPNDMAVSGGTPARHHQETCATVEWLMFTAQLYRVTGQVRYVEMMERVIYNALLAAQSEDGQSWMYFTPLRYEKRFFTGPTSCCYWSGPRGLARLPGWVYALDHDGLRVDFYEASQAQLSVNGVAVSVEQMTQYPHSGQATIRLAPERPVRFTLRLRHPPQAGRMSIAINGAALPAALLTPLTGGYYALERTWAEGDQVSVTFDLTVRVSPFLAHDYGVVQRGPEILAIDERDNPGLDLDQIALPAALSLNEFEASQGRRRYQGQVSRGGQLAPVVFTPYADCGGDGARFRTAFPIVT